MGIMKRRRRVLDGELCVGLVRLVITVEIISTNQDLVGTILVLMKHFPIRLLLNVPVLPWN